MFRDRRTATTEPTHRTTSQRAAKIRQRISGNIDADPGQCAAQPVAWIESHLAEQVVTRHGLGRIAQTERVAKRNGGGEFFGTTAEESADCPARLREGIANVPKCVEDAAH
jgi:hypothetical protein